MIIDNIFITLYDSRKKGERMKNAFLRFSYIILSVIIIFIPVLISSSELKIIAANPAPATFNSDSVRELVFTFSKPFTALSNVKDLDIAYECTPPVKGHFRARGTDVLAFIPDKPFLPDREYEFILKKGIISPDSSMMQDDYKLIVKPVRLFVRYTDLQYEHIPVNHKFHIYFNYPVNPLQKGLIKLYSGNAEIPLNIISRNKTSDVEISLQGLTKGANYRLSVFDSVLMQTSYTYSFRAIEELKFSGNMTVHDIMYQEETGFYLEFTAPVKPSDVRNNIRLFDNDKEITLNYSYYYGNSPNVRFYVFAMLEPRKTYTLDIGKSIKDITGSYIKNPGKYTLETYDYMPFLNFSGGYMYPAGKLNAYVEMMNRDYFNIAVRFMDVQAYIGLIASLYENYYDWYYVLENRLNASNSFRKKHFTSTIGRNTLDIYDIDLNKEFSDNSWLGMGYLEYMYDKYDTIRTEFFFQKSPTKIIGLFAARNGLLLINDRNSGEPVGSGKLLLLNSKGSTVNRYSFSGGMYRFSRNELALLDKHASDKPAYFLSLTNSGQSLLTFLYSKPEDELRMMAFPDRDLCKLNDSLNIIGIVRYKQANRVICPGTAKFDYEIYNPVSKKVFSGTLNSDKLGAFSHKVIIPDSFITGQYYISYKMNGKYCGSTYFNVQEFREPEYSVTVSPDSILYHSNSTLGTAVDAVYLTGEKMIGDSVYFFLSSYRTSFYSDSFPGYNFYIESDTIYFDNPIIKDKGKLDKNGHYKFSSKMKNISRNPLSLNYTATVVSGKKESISSSAYGRYIPMNTYVGLKVEQPDTAKNDSVKFSCIAVDPYSGTVPNVKCKVTVMKSYDYYGNEADTVAVFSMKTGAKPVSDYFMPDEDALYRVVLEYGDNRVSGNLYYQKRTSSYDMPFPSSPYIMSDKSMYDVGDTVRLSIISPVDNGMLYMFYGTDSIYGIEKRACSRDTAEFSIPVTEDFVGGFYTGAFIFTEDPLYDQSYQSYFINVNSESKRIDLSLKTDLEEYEPGDSVIITLTSDCFDAEAIISVTDESVLMLTGYSMPDPFYSMYSYYSNPIMFSNSAVLPNVYSGYKYRNGGGYAQLEETAVMDKAMPATSEPAFAAEDERKKTTETITKEGSALSDVELRKDFAAAPFFSKGVKFEKGKAVLKFKLPDNTTKFRITAIAYSKDKFGRNEKAINVTKKLLIRNGLPNFLRPFDEFNAEFQVSDYTDIKGNIKAGLSAMLCYHTGDSILSISPSDKKAFPSFRMNTGIGDSAVFILSAEKEGYSDYLRYSIPVIDKYIYEHSAVFGSTEDSMRQYVDLKVAELAEHSSVEITMYPSQIAQTDLPIRYLKAYPYECLEQKMSRIFPYLTGEDVINTFKMGDLQGKNLRKYVNTVISQVGRFQDSNGGFKYYEDSRYASEYLSIYVMYGLHLAEKAGYKIDKTVKENGIRYIQSIARGNFSVLWSYSKYAMYSMRCFAMYVLYLYDDKSYNEDLKELYDMREYLYYSERGRLLELLDAYGMKNSADTLYSELLSDIRIETGYAYFDDMMNDWWLFQSELKNTAVILSSILRTGREFPFAEKTVRFFSLRAKNGMWLNTHTTALVLEALNEYYRHYEKDKPQFTAYVRNSGKELMTAKFKNYSDTPVSDTVQLDELGSEAVDLIKKGTGRLYYIMTMKYAVKGNIKPLFNGFDVQRKITDLNGKKVSEYRKGDVYKVTVIVKTDKSRVFAVIDDPLPAGFDIVKTGFRTEYIDDRSDDKYYGYWWGGFSHEEYYRDKAVAAAVYLSEGTHEYSYYVRAICSGDFSYPPVNVFEMYTPEVFGHSGSGRIVIK